MTKKLIALTLVLCFFLLSGCGNVQQTPSESAPSSPTGECAPKNELRLLYCENDTMNPYKTISKLNAEIATLLFEPLFTVDNNFEAVKVLAQEAVFEDVFCRVTLAEAKFSDGSELTAEDVVYSYGLAKESTRFSPLLYEIKSVTAEGNKTVVFELSVKDPYFTKLLTFPILKTGSDQLKNEDNVELTPIGTGKYVFSEDSLSLVANKHFRANVGEIQKINLINAPDNESMQHYVEVGATDLYYAEMYDDRIIRMSGKKYTVNLNNLIYIGINHNFAPLKNASLRYALSSALSRNEIIDTSHYTDALAATGFFHPAWKETSGYQTIQSEANLKISVENLANIGYNILNEEGFYENSEGQILELHLLVNKDNYSKLQAAELISTQLNTAGIKIIVDAKDKASYFKDLADGNFQLYLGEIRFLPNMDISCLVKEGGTAAFGITSPENKNTEDKKEDEDQEETEKPAVFDDEYSYLSVLEGFYSGTNTAVDLASSLLASMPVIPVAYRSSIVFYSENIEEFSSASCYDLFIKSDKFKLK